MTWVRIALASTIALLLACEPGVERPPAPPETTPAAEAELEAELELDGTHPDAPKPKLEFQPEHSEPQTQAEPEPGKEPERAEDGVYGLGSTGHYSSSGTNPDRRVKDLDRQIRVLEVHTDGGLDETHVRRLVDDRKIMFSFCYELGLADDPDLGGRLELAFVIGADGRPVRPTYVDDESAALAAVGACFGRQLKRIKFARPRPGGEVHASVRFKLTPR